MAQLERALRACGRRLVLEDIPDDSGHHLTESAVGDSGTLGMTRGEFIRRIRRYAWRTSSSGGWNPCRAGPTSPNWISMDAQSPCRTRRTSGTNGSGPPWTTWG